MANKKISIRSLALAPMAGFRTGITDVPEWGNVKVKLREPSGKAWIEWREIINPEADAEAEPLTPAQVAHRNMQADIVLFMDVLLDENDEPVFGDSDREVVAEIYGPVHARLLKQALDLGMDQATAEKK